jgi:hypothetical protein
VRVDLEIVDELTTNGGLFSLDEFALSTNTAYAAQAPALREGEAAAWFDTCAEEDGWTIHKSESVQTA